MHSDKEIVGLIPAGGQATRLSPLPCSKELFPLGFAQWGEPPLLRPKVSGHYLLDKMKAAGAKKVFWVLRKGKWDIPAYFGDGAALGMNMAYLIMGVSYGHPYTLDQAHPFLENFRVAFGYPDILFEPADAFVHLEQKQAETGADVVLGVFPLEKGINWDVIVYDEEGNIEQIAATNTSTLINPMGWAIALWTPTFTAFMHRFLTETIEKNQVTTPEGKEYSLDHIFQTALDRGLNLATVDFPEGFVLDVGTPENLIRAQQMLLDAEKALK